ncbi:MAG: type IX secretion system sortase PorU [Gemmatimonadota bacterium]|nr:MAG: type IX secretion system sortase PorU [Gemmatimonadota bacterium]
MNFGRNIAVVFGVLMWGAPLNSALETARSGETGLLLRRTDETGVTFDYYVPEIEDMTFPFDGQIYHRVRLAGFGCTDQVGAPQLPQMRLLVGVPLEGDVEAALIDAAYEERGGYRVGPVPTLVRPTEAEDTFFREEYIPHPEFYSEDAFTPERVIEVEQPSFLRNQRVAAIILRPLQFNPVTGILRIHSKISVSIRFRGSGTVSPYPQGSSVDHFENVYQRTLINYETSKRWRKRPHVRLEKGSLFQDDAEWIKMTVREDGIYRVDFDDLSEVVEDMAAIDPATIRISYGGGRELPRDVFEPRPDSLTEIAIIVNGEEDGTFDAGDHIIFYGQGVSGWDYDPDVDDYAHYFHRFTDDNVYWLTFGPNGQQGKRMTAKDGSPTAPNPERFHGFRDRIHEEHEGINPKASGLTWYWRTSSGGETGSFRADLPGALQDSVCTVSLRMKGKTRGQVAVHEVKVSFNNRLISHETFHSENVLTIQESGRGWVVDGENELRVEHVRQPGSDPTIQDQFYFDWYEIRYWRRFEAHHGSLAFSAPRGSEVVEYRLSGFPEDSILVFDVTDPENVAALYHVTRDETLAFQDVQDPFIEKRYLAVALERMKSPISIVGAEPWELRDPSNRADYLIVTHEGFVPDVEPLRAHRRDFDPGYEAKVITTSAIYDEFSWGLFDPTAIRDFLKYAAGNWEVQPEYVLLVGDGNYDYKNNSLTSPGNWVPPYENGSEAYDDWYVYLDAGILPDMCIGRLPARSRQQVQHMVAKIIDYDLRPTFGQWRNRMLFMADDELVGCQEESWNVRHTNDSETVSDTLPKNFQQIKIYLMGYELGQNCEKPSANEDLLTHLNKGVLLFNYIGHGGYNVMADEHVFRSSRDLPRLTNESMPFLLAAFTCDVGVFDHPIEESMAEDLVRLENRGAIASVAASRLTSSGPNLDLSQQFYSNLFLSGFGHGKTRPLGMALLEGKVEAASASNGRLYLLFGDPAQTLGTPRHEVVLTHLEPATLQALNMITLEGAVVDSTGTILQEFEGTAIVDVFDSLRDIIHITPETNREVRYQLPGAVLFRGFVPVTQGTFRTQFVIPKDITYDGTTGRLCVYAFREASDGVGYRDSLSTVGGSVEVVDSVGPLIELTIKGREETFAEGDYVRSDEILTATLFDSSGINLTGETGHWIVLRIDGDDGTRQDLTSSFVYEEGSYQKGTIEYELSDLNAGDHTIEVKAWDNHNNASVQLLSLRVASAEDFRLLHVMNYPNPFFRETNFTYELTGPAREVLIKIYTVAGRLIETFSAPGDLGFNHISWEAYDRDGDALANGVYLYKMIASGIEGRRHEVIGRLIIMK